MPTVKDRDAPGARRASIEMPPGGKAQLREDCAQASAPTRCGRWICQRPAVRRPQAPRL